MINFFLSSKSGSLNATCNNPTKFYYGSKDGCLSKLPEKKKLANKTNAVNTTKVYYGSNDGLLSKLPAKAFNSVGRRRILNKPKLNESSSAKIIPEKEINLSN